MRGVEGLARSAVSTSFRSGSVGVGFQLTFSCAAALTAFFLAFGDDADEIADPDHGDQPGNIADRSLVDRDQAGADKGAGIDAGIGRTHHAAMQHAGHAHVVDIDEFAGRLRRQIDARHRLPDDAVGIDGLDRDIVGEFEADGLVADQFAIADAAVIFAADQAVFDRERSPTDSSSRSAARASRNCRACAAALRKGTAVIWMVSLAMVGP